MQMESNENDRRPVKASGVKWMGRLMNATTHHWQKIGSGVEIRHLGHEDCPRVEIRDGRLVAKVFSIMSLHLMCVNTQS